MVRRKVPQPVTALSPESVGPKAGLRRWLLAGVGVLCVGLAGVGVVVPGLPTTVFLLLASYCFTKSCPWLEERLIRTRFFRPYLRFLDGDAEMPRKAKAATILLIWVAVAGSCLMMASRGAVSPWFVIPVVTGAVVGSAFVWRGFSSGARRSR